MFKHIKLRDDLMNVAYKYNVMSKTRPKGDVCIMLKSFGLVMEGVSEMAYIVLVDEPDISNLYIVNRYGLTSCDENHGKDIDGSYFCIPITALSIPAVKDAVDKCCGVGIIRGAESIMRFVTEKKEMFVELFKVGRYMRDEVGMDTSATTHHVLLRPLYGDELILEMYHEGSVYKMHHILMKSYAKTNDERVIPFLSLLHDAAITIMNFHISEFYCNGVTLKSEIMTQYNHVSIYEEKIKEYRKMRYGRED